MIYCDTSLVVSAITVERGSSESRRWIAGRAELALSAWVATEVAAALAMKQRQDLLSTAERLRVQTGWRAMLAASFAELEVARADFDRAEQLVDLGRGCGQPTRCTSPLRCGMAVSWSRAITRWRMRRPRQA